MEKFKTDQEKFWAGDFGDEYTQRNQNKQLFAANLALFSKILSRTKNVKSVIEFGANIGINLQAIRNLIPEVKLAAVEINTRACKQLSLMNNIKVYNQSISDFESKSVCDFVLLKGVLIHLNPSELSQVYDLMYRSSQRYVCIIEYYNPSPISINYRGHTDKLFKRDFAGEFLKKFTEFSLIDYGFIYHKDNNFSQDDVTWFLLEKLS